MEYYIKTLPANFDGNQIGNYVFAKLFKGKWVPIGIGEGVLHNAVSDVQKLENVLEKGATHIHVRLNPNVAERIEEEADLRASYEIY